jgi:ABC-type Fe3+ transport system permease subunit
MLTQRGVTRFMPEGTPKMRRRRMPRSTARSVIERIDPSIEEVSASLGATPFETWRLVTLPMIYPGLVAASTLSFILSMNAYATPVLLGGAELSNDGTRDR